MTKMYFVSYNFCGVHTKNPTSESGYWSRIQNDIISEFPIIWERNKNDEFSKSKDIENVTRIRIIWWKELTDEEIELLNL